LKKVISYSLYGNNPRYLVGAVKNAILAKEHMPDWESWFYVDEDVPQWTLQTLELIENSRIIPIEFNELKILKASYRFLVFEDPEVDVAVARDADSRVSARDILAIKEWLDSGLPFHIMKDHPIGHSYLMSAGMFGARSGKLSGIQDKLVKFFRENPFHAYGADQSFLAQEIYEDIKNDCFYHSEHYDCNPTGNSIQKMFPTLDRYPDNHIGAALNENDEYVFSVDVEASIDKNGINKYVYDFDLLGER
jgi:hypothetical protein